MKLVMFTNYRTNGPILINPEQVACITEEWLDNAKPEDKPYALSIGFSSGFAVTVKETISQALDKLGER